MNNNCNFEGCTRKLKLSDYPCKCRNIYCKYHRLPNQHMCCYDYKEQHNKDKQIEKLKCVSTKIIKI